MIHICIQICSDDGFFIQISSDEGFCIQICSDEGFCIQISSDEGFCIQISSDEGFCIQYDVAAFDESTAGYIFTWECFSCSTTDSRQTTTTLWFRR